MPSAEGTGEWEVEKGGGRERVRAKRVGEGKNEETGGGWEGGRRKKGWIEG